MSAQCPTCGGILTHYSSDGVKISTVLENNPNYNIILKNHGSNYMPDSSLVTEGGHPLPEDKVNALWEQHIKDCSKCNGASDSSVQFSDIQPQDDGVTILNGENGWRKGESGGYVRSAAMKKEAIWYFLKPRWIIRRKLQAAVRRKVRAQLHPITFIKHDAGGF